MQNKGDDGKVRPITTDPHDLALINVRAAQQSFGEIARRLEGPAFPSRATALAASHAPASEEPVVEEPLPATANVVAFRPRSSSPETKTPA